MGKRAAHGDLVKPVLSRTEWGALAETITQR